MWRYRPEIKQKAAKLRQMIKKKTTKKKKTIFPGLSMKCALPESRLCKFFLSSTRPTVLNWVWSEIKPICTQPFCSLKSKKKQLGKGRWKWDHAATLLKTRRRAFKNNPRSEHMLLVLALVTARPATGKCNLSKAPYLCDTWKAACKMLSLSNTLIYQVGAKWSDATCFSGDFFTASSPGPPEPTCDIQLCLRFPSQQSSCGAETYLEKQLKKSQDEEETFFCGRQRGLARQQSPLQSTDG